MSETVSLHVTEQETGMRLDSYLAQHFVEASRSRIQKWIAADRVKVNRVPRKRSYQLSGGDHIEVQPLPQLPLEVVPEELPLEVLHEDRDLLVVNKPAGLVVHPGAGNRTGTLANALVYHLEELSRGDTVRPGIVHRLDKGTSGVLVVAKTEQAHDALALQFQQRSVRKVYLALLHGRISPQQDEINQAIGRDLRSRVRISTRTAKPREAITRYEVIRYLREFSYVRVMPLTGRTHQIRVHFSLRGHPVVGDDIYGGRLRHKGYERLCLNRLFLHATLLEFEHPGTRQRMSFEVGLPSSLGEIMLTLDD